MSSEWPHTLLDKSIYPHRVDQLRLIETHISWVVLTGPYAYKIKKPVAFDFLDFSTLELRKQFCQRELELNRRFSRNLYLDVVALTGDREHPHINGSGEVFDYAVKMRQFDSDQLADNLAKRGGLSDGLIKKLALALARLHRDLPAVSDELAQDAAENLIAAAVQNFEQMRAYPLPQDIQIALAAVEQWTMEAYQACRALMEQRQQQGFIKDCHGDCHLGNITIIDGEVTLFDCIEFNDRFRIMDTMAEAAFLFMDLSARNLPEKAQRFLNSYLEYRGDYAGLLLLNLYCCYYAMVRAKVNLMKEPASDQHRISADTDSDFYHYVELSKQFTQASAPVLVLMHGFSGSGKSYLAEHVAAQIKAIRIRSDVERKRLFNLSPDQSGSNLPELYSSETSKKTFDRLLQLCELIIKAGFSCIVDATFLTVSSREPFVSWAISENTPLTILHCHADEETILSRLRRRATEGGDPSDADVEVYRQQKLIVDEFSIEERQHLIEINTERHNYIDSAIIKLKNRFIRN